ncbi:MAG: rhodanese-like domain-containing protein [Acinetobacter sp.]
MTQRQAILIETNELDTELANVVLLDATVILARPEFDGDYRVASGYSDWETLHIPNSVHVDLYQDLANTQVDYSFAVPDAQVVQNFLQDLGVKKETALVVYDSKDGIWAARLWWLFRSFGVDSRILNGGLTAWVNEGYATETGQKQPVHREKGDIAVQPQPHFWLSLTQVQQLAEQTLPNTTTNLICALGEDYFKGTAITRYARRGIIPNSDNIPARHFIGANNKFLANAEIVKILQDLSPENGLKALYCGGGISACILAVAFSLVTDNPIAIYDGSLQEWALHSNLPLVQGEK